MGWPRSYATGMVLAFVVLFAGAAGALGNHPAERPGRMWSVDLWQIINTRPTVFDGVAYLILANQSCAAYDLELRKLLWWRDVPNLLNIEPLLDRQRIFLADRDGIVVLRRQDGELLWRANAMVKNGRCDILTGCTRMFWDDEATLVVVASPEKIVGLRKQDGAEQWSLQVDRMVPWSGFMVDGVFVVEQHDLEGEKLSAIDVHAKEILWSRRHSSFPTRIFQANNEVLLIDRRQTNADKAGLLAVEIKSGKDLWTIDKPFGTAKCTGAGKLFLFQAGEKIRAYSLRDGGRVWEQKMSEDSFALEPCVLHAGTVVAAEVKRDSNLGHLVFDGVSSEDGQQLWFQAFPDRPYWIKGLAPWREKLLFGSDRGLVALDEKTGSGEVVASFGRRAHALLGVDGNAFLGTQEGDLIAVDGKSGRYLARFHLDSSSTEPMFRRKDLIILRTADGDLIGADPCEQQSIWRLPANATPRGVGLFGDRLVACGSDGSLRAFDANTGHLDWVRELKSPCRWLEADGAGKAWVAGDTWVEQVQVESGRSLQWIPVGDHLEWFGVREGKLIVQQEGGIIQALAKGGGRTKWSYRHQRDFAPFVTSRGMAFINDGYELVAVALGAGKVLWRTELVNRGFRRESDHEHVLVSPQVVGDRVFAVSRQETIWAVDVGSGMKRWRYHVPSGAAEVVASVKEERLFVLSRNGLLDSVDLSRPDGRFYREPSEGCTGRPEIVEELALVPGHGYLVARRLKNGAKAWRLKMPGRSRFVGEHLLASDRGRLCAVDPQKARFRWCTELKSNYVTSMQVDGDRLLVVSANSPGFQAYDDRINRDGKYSDLTCLDGGTGRVLWRFRPVETLDGKPSLHPMAGVIVLRTKHGALFAVDRATGALRWYVESGLSRQGLYVSTTDGIILNMMAEDGVCARMLDAESGRVVWEREALGAPSSVVTGGVLRLHAKSNRHRCVSVKDGTDLPCPQRLFSNERYEKEYWEGRRARIADGIYYASCYPMSVCAKRITDEKELWRVKLKGEVWGQPVLKDNILYYGTQAGEFGAIDIEGMSRRTVNPAAP